MAIEDRKEFDVRGLKVIVSGEKTGPQTYRFTGQVGEIKVPVNVHVNPHGKPIDVAQMQAWIDEARQVAAEETAKAYEHADLEAQID